MAATMPPTLLTDSDPLNPTLTALSTLSLLNVRLSRLEYLLTGSSQPSSDPSIFPPDTDLRNTSPNIPTQLRTLESRLTTLKRLDGLHGTLVRMVDSLRREYPELFSGTSTSTSASDPPNTPQPTPHTLSLQATEVLSHAPLYTTTSAHLQTLQTLRIPPAALTANLLEAAPRVQELKRRQEALDEEILELKRRSAGVVEWWVKNGVVGMGELFEDWEGRVRVCEREIARAERRRGGNT